MKMSRTGAIVVQINQRAEKVEGQRKFDNENRVTFRLGPKDIGKLLTLGKNEYLASLINNKELSILLVINQNSQ